MPVRKLDLMWNWKYVNNDVSYVVSGKSNLLIHFRNSSKQGQILTNFYTNSVTSRAY